MKKIIEAYWLKDHILCCLFNDGVLKRLDFKLLFEKWVIQTNDIAYPIATNIELFRQFGIANGTLSWENIGLGVHSKDETGAPVFYPYELDPLVLYQSGETVLKLPKSKVSKLVESHNFPNVCLLLA